MDFGVNLDPPLTALGHVYGVYVDREGDKRVGNALYNLYGVSFHCSYTYTCVYLIYKCIYTPVYKEQADVTRQQTDISR